VLEAGGPDLRPEIHDLTRFFDYQTIIVLLACLAQNSWARHTWQNAQPGPDRRQPQAA
jgi:hypothetical protein